MKRKYVQKTEVKTYVGKEEITNEIELSVMAESLEEAKTMFFRIMKDNSYVGFGRWEVSCAE